MTGFPQDSDRPAEKSGDQGAGSGEPERRSGRDEEQGEPEGFRVRDNRRIDPKTFQARPQPAVEPVIEVPDDISGLESIDGAPVEGASDDSDSAVPESVAADERVVELTADLQRLSAEYANYRRRVERDRKLQAELTSAAIMTSLLPVLDDVQRAGDHGELDAGFKAVGDAIQTVAETNGVVRFGEVGESFDPNFHEAMTSDTSPDVTEPTVTRVYQVGYRIGDRVLRAARVGVSDAE